MAFLCHPGRGFRYGAGASQRTCNELQNIDHSAPGVDEDGNRVANRPGFAWWVGASNPLENQGCIWDFCTFGAGRDPSAEPELPPSCTSSRSRSCFVTYFTALCNMDSH